MSADNLGGDRASTPLSHTTPPSAGPSTPISPSRTTNENSRIDAATPLAVSRKCRLPLATGEPCDDAGPWSAKGYRTHVRALHADAHQACTWKRACGAAFVDTEKWVRHVADAHMGLGGWTCPHGCGLARGRYDAKHFRRCDGRPYQAQKQDRMLQDGGDQ